MALPDCFINDKVPDATGCTNDQNGHAEIGHDISFLFGVAALAMLTT
jgi:hypothetical protein